MSDAHKAVVSAHFDSYASTWHDRLAQHSYATRYRVVARLIAGVAPRRVLDIGCGTGDYCRLFDASVDYVGYDFSDNMIAECRRRYPAFRFELGDAESIPERDGLADLVLDVGVLEYYEDPRRHLRELARVTRPGGSVVITVPNAENVTRAWVNAAGAVIGRLRGLKVDRTKDPLITHKRFSLPQLTEAAAAVGLRIADHSFAGVRLAPSRALNTAVSARVSDKPGWEWFTRYTGTLLACRFVRA
ncbi:MAG: methyltransferase domain-containing protein [Alphaproteobacteria bacterium]|nr:methyltransferase domain-containing protein [Alphaproteobacteria bacterium]